MAYHDKVRFFWCFWRCFLCSHESPGGAGHWPCQHLGSIAFFVPLSFSVEKCLWLFVAYYDLWFYNSMICSWQKDSFFAIHGGIILSFPCKFWNLARCSTSGGGQDFQNFGSLLGAEALAQQLLRPGEATLSCERFTSYHVLSWYTDIPDIPIILSMSILDGSLDQLFSGMISWLHVWCDAGLWTCAVASSGGQVPCVWNCGAWKLSKSWKHFLEDDKSFVGRVKEVWIFHVHDIRTVFSFQVQAVLSNFRKGSLYHGRIQNFPKPFASHRIRQVASEALST